MVLNSLDKQVRIGYSDYFSEKNMASYVIPVKISNDLTGIFEIVIPMRMLLSELYSNNKNSDVFFFFFMMDEWSNLLKQFQMENMLVLQKMS